MKNLTRTGIALGIISLVIIFLVLKRDQNSHGRPQSDNEEVAATEYPIAVYDSENSKIQTFSLKLEKFQTPIVIEVPNVSGKYERTNDSLIVAYIASCNPVTTDYEKFVQFTTEDYRILTNRNDRATYQAEMASIIKSAKEKGFETKTNAILLYKITIKGEFGEVCYLVKLPSLLTIDDVDSTLQKDLSFIFFRKFNDSWKLETPDKLDQLRLGFLDYKNINSINQISNAQRVTLNSEGMIEEIN